MQLIDPLLDAFHCNTHVTYILVTLYCLLHYVLKHLQELYYAGELHSLLLLNGLLILSLNSIYLMIV